MQEQGTPLSIDLIERLGFVHNQTSPFEGIVSPYYVKNGLLLFGDSTDESLFSVGFANMRFGKYHAVNFHRFVRTEEELRSLYHAVTNQILP